jgi:UDP-glucose 4-epimerase
LKNKKSFILNLGYGEGYSVKEIINFFEKKIKHKIKILFKNKREGDVAKIIANNSKMMKLFPKWKRSFSINQSISNSILWEKKLKKLNLTTQ